MSTSGCPTGPEDTCAADGGLDIENLMDDSYDVCMYAFTRGPSARTNAVWRAFRAQLYPLAR